MTKFNTLSIQATIVAWSVFLTVFIVPQFFYFLTIYGFFDYEDNDKLVEVPIMIDRLSLKPRDNLRGCRGNIKMSSLPCISGRFSYIYKGETYHSKRIAAGMLRVPDAKAESILEKLKSEKLAYIQPHNPEYALLIPRQEYISYQPTNSATEWFRRFATIPAIFTLALFSAMYLPRKATGKEVVGSERKTYGVGFLWLRLLAFWVDLSVYVFSVSIFIVVFGLFYLSDYTQKSDFVQYYLYFGFLAILILSSLIFSRTLGMYAFGLKIVDAKTGKVPALWQRIIRILGVLLVVATAGIPLIISLFSRNRRSIADMLSGTKVVREFIDGETVFSVLIKAKPADKSIENDRDINKTEKLQTGDRILIGVVYLAMLLTVGIFVLLALQSKG